MELPDQMPLNLAKPLIIQELDPILETEPASSPPAISTKSKFDFP
jgi:hypothetical protein